MIYDPNGDRIISHSGSETYQMTLTGPPTWLLLALGPSRTDPTAIYDSANERMVMYSGLSDDAWGLDLVGTPVWTHILAGSPLSATQSSATAIYDPIRQRMLSFGLSSEYPNELISLSLDSTPEWEIAEAGVHNLPRYDRFYTFIRDQLRERSVGFGGELGATAGACYAFVHGAPPVWMNVSTTPPIPTRRTGHTLVYSASNDAVVLYGGRDLITGDVLNEIWVGTLSSDPVMWTQVTSLPGLARRLHSAIWDPVRGQMVVFGGLDDGDVAREDIWAVNPFHFAPSWTRLRITFPTGPRTGHSAIYHPTLDKMMIYGGHVDDPSVYYFDIATASYTSIDGTGAQPGLPRANHAAIYDPDSDRMVVFGGFFGFSYLNDSWEFRFDTADHGWRRLGPGGAPPSPRAYTSAVYEPVGHAMHVFGGFGGAFNADVMSLQFVVPSAVLTRPARAAGSLTAIPNPGQGMTLRVAGSAAGQAVKVEISDCAGRVVWAGAMGRETSVYWDGRAQDGSEVRPGVYFARCRGQAEQATRVVLLR